LTKIEFGKPNFRDGEIDGVAFVEGYEKTVGFTLSVGSGASSLGNLRLSIDDLYQAIYVYKFFVKLSENYIGGKSYNNSGSMRKFSTGLFIQWDLAETKIDDVLLNVKKAMGLDWKNALGALFSVARGSGGIDELKEKN
jgi:hypothetical protein